MSRSFRTVPMLRQIEKAIASCRKCRLHRTRTNTVPGEGNPNAKIMFVGQCPGFNEDREGRPFVGRAGALLTTLLASIDLKREEVYITNIVKDRPPNNRDPMVDEVRACKPYLDEQIKTINPKLIVALGRFATEHFIKGGSISKLHGQPVAVNGRIVLPLYHPAAALRSETVLRELEKDFLKIPKLLETKVDDLESVGAGKKDKNQLELL